MQQSYLHPGGAGQRQGEHIGRSFSGQRALAGLQLEETTTSANRSKRVAKIMNTQTFQLGATRHQAPWFFDVRTWLLLFRAGALRSNDVSSQLRQCFQDFDQGRMQKVLHKSKRKREPDVVRNGWANDVGVRLETAKGVACGHAAKLGDQPACLKLVLFNRAARRHSSR